MHNMTEIASGNKGDERAAVQAARFLESVHQDLEERTGEKGSGKGGVHPAKLLRDSFMKPRALHRTTVVEEPEIADDSCETVVHPYQLPSEIDRNSTLSVWPPSAAILPQSAAPASDDPVPIGLGQRSCVAGCQLSLL
jgi:hypothetical protein